MDPERLVPPVQQGHRLSRRQCQEHERGVEAYGLSENAMYAVGAAKVGLAGMLLAGHAAPRLVRPASIGLAGFMLGAIGMHIKVGDPVKRYLPALTVFSLATTSAILNGKPAPAEAAKS
ncbi:MAG: DoxX family protein [Mycobacteriaceae bacterium]